MYVPDFLGRAEQVALERELRALPYEHDTFRGQRLKRAYARFGFAYVSTGRLLTPAAPLPDFATALIERGTAHCPAGSRFNQCIVTHYPAGAGSAGTSMPRGSGSASWRSAGRDR